jgi:thioester reductase-like protein
MRVHKIICLIRASDAAEAKERLSTSFSQRKLNLSWTQETTVQACASNPTDVKLGLPDAVYSQLSSEVTTIIHCAWPVNFLAHFDSFSGAIRGTKNMLELAASGGGGQKKRFVFCSSIASVARSPARPIREELSENPEHATLLGYARSKWVAEGIVRAAGGEVVRLGQLSGDTKMGIWNPEESWPLIMKTLKQVKCLPELEENVQWLPIDVAAEAVARIAIRPPGRHEDRKIWHVLNPCLTPWSKILGALERWCGMSVKRVSPNEWLGKLEDSERTGGVVKLLELWKDWVSFILSSFCSSVSWSCIVWKPRRGKKERGGVGF